MATVKFLGINDDVTTCEKCGKTDLKRTVAIQFEDGSIANYGCDCAARALHTNKKLVAATTRELNTIGEKIAILNKWIAAGHSLQACRDGVWNKFGYLCEVKAGVLRIQFSDTFTYTTGGGE